MANRWKPNVTVAAVIERDGFFLLVEEHTADGLRLNNPAGHLDPGESLEQACIRETLEETTFGFRPEALVGVYLTGPVPNGVEPQSSSGSGITYLRFAFRGVLGAAHPERQLDRGIVRTVWMSAQEVRDSRDRHRSPVLLQCVEDYLAGRSFPLELVRTEVPGV
jgi:8-oxo-dGTP pyrophosphatase MutT (NUDIX family)